MSLHTRFKGWAEIFGMFGGFALLLWITTDFSIPWFAETKNVEPVIAWFVTGAVFVLIPMLIASFVILARERVQGRQLAERLRFRRLDKLDGLWAIGAIVAIAVFTSLIQAALVAFTGDAKSQPAFMEFPPLTTDRYWILAAWLPFWILNIGAEEVLWRGVLLPRQEQLLGRSAWLANAAGWLLFHFAFGWRIAVLLLPIIVILPFVVQRRKNTNLGLLLHAALNGPAFIAIALGYA